LCSTCWFFFMLKPKKGTFRKQNNSLMSKKKVHLTN
jgi:hypothetical protein